jgi:hypothetical protein
MPSSGMWRHVDILLTDVSEERIASICSHLLTLAPCSRISHTLKMEAICSSETSVNTISTWCHIPEDGILQRKLLFALYDTKHNFMTFQAQTSSQFTVIQLKRDYLGF